MKEEGEEREKEREIHDWKEEKENSESYPEWKKERGVDLRKREISTSFSPARNHLECSRATSSRRIKVLFWGENSLNVAVARKMASLSGNFSVNRDREESFSIRPPCLSTTGRYNEIRLPLPWQASLKGTASEVTRDGAR